jgi:hypothetical protein
MCDRFPLMPGGRGQLVPQLEPAERTSSPCRRERLGVDHLVLARSAGPLREAFRHEDERPVLSLSRRLASPLGRLWVACRQVRSTTH